MKHPDGSNYSTAETIGFYGGLIMTALLFLGLWIWCVEDLWNFTMPEIFGVKEITYWQAARLLILIHILFGSVRIWFDKNSSTPK